MASPICEKRLSAEPAADEPGEHPLERRAIEAELPRYPPAGPPSKELIEALAMALAAVPGNRQPVSAEGMLYFRAEARRRLSLTDDAVARDLLLGFCRHRATR